MSGLPFRAGTWRGTGWAEVERGRVEFEQQETVRSPLDGEVITIEGRASTPGQPEDVRFRAFAVASVAGGVATWKAWSGGHVVEVPLLVDGPSYRWEFEAAPGVLVRYDGRVDGESWQERGGRSTDRGTTWTPMFEMDLRPQP